MEITQKRVLNRTYTLFSGGTVESTAYPVQIALHHLPDSLLRCYLHTLDGKQIWSCEHTGMMSLWDYCEDRPLDCEEIKWIWRGIIESLLETEAFLLETDCLYLDIEEIYVEPDVHRVCICYVPFEKESIWERMQELAQQLLGYVDQRDAQAVQMAYGIFRYLAGGGCDVDALWLLLLELEKQPSEESVSLIPEEPMVKESVFVDANTKKKVCRMNFFPKGRWILSLVPIALALFLLAFVTLNEWYLTNQKKILLLGLAAALWFLGALFWRKWHRLFRKYDVFEMTEKETKEEQTKTGTP